MKINFLLVMDDEYSSVWINGICVAHSTNNLTPISTMLLLNNFVKDNSEDGVISELNVRCFNSDVYTGDFPGEANTFEALNDFHLLETGKELRVANY